MKALIERLAIGNVDYETPQANISQDDINIELNIGDTQEGRFSVKSVTGMNIKGVVYSSDSHLRILNGQFLGKDNTVRYEVNTECMHPGEHVEGKIDIVTNAGEFSIPFKINVREENITTTEGVIKDLKDFTRLVQVSYEEAVKLFMSKEFKTKLVDNDVYASALYTELMRNTNRALALEEFLVKMGLKEPVTISIVDSEKNYEDLTESYGDVLNITKSGWGYVEIDVEIKGDILYNCKNKITYDNFAGNLCEYQYLINAVKLHQGENNAEITLKTVNQTLTYRVNVKNPAKDVSKHVQSKREIVEIMDNYLKFRTGAMNSVQWMEVNRKIANERLSRDPEDVVGLIVKTQLTILAGDETNIGYYLTLLSSKVATGNMANVEYYCYYLYLKTIYKKNAEYTEEVRKEIKSYFDSGHDTWQLLWMIMYMDDRYNQNPSLKYTLVKDQFNKGCMSPVMFFEAAKIINEQPELLRIINKFEIMLLNFASKYNMVNEKLTEQIVMLFEKEKEFNKIQFKILTRIYENTRDVNALNGICRMLINGEKTDRKYFKWYEAGVKKELKITKLYEYYIYSMDTDNMDKFLPQAYKYFAFSTESLMDNRAYLYNNIIHNFDKGSEMYVKFEEEMKQYATREIIARNIDSHLAEIYKEVIDDKFIIGEMGDSLPGILNAWKIKVENKNITDVVVFHKELRTPQQVHLVDGEAYIEIYTENPIILFMDKHRNRYANIPYECDKLLKFVKISQRGNDNVYTKLCAVEKCLNNPAENIGMAQELKEMINEDKLTSAYRKYLLKGIVDYYYEKFDCGSLNKFIMEINMNELEKESRDRVISVMITRKMYRNVYPYIMEYGIQGLDTETIAKFCAGIIEETEYEEDGTILKMCANLFRKNCMDDVILKFLGKYFNGTSEEMYSLYRKMIIAEIEDNSLVERILVQLIFEGDTSNVLHEIYSRYVKNPSYSVVRKAYYTFVAYNYFVKDIQSNQSAWDIMEQDIADGLDVTVIVKIAYLAKLLEDNSPSERQIEIAKNLMSQLAKKNIIFEFYKKFNRWFYIPYSVIDKTVIDYRTNPKHKVYITYKIRSQRGETKEKTEEMRSVYAGIFTKDLIMFYGEELEYFIEEITPYDSIETKKQVMKISRKDMYNDESRFGMLNSMMICKDLGRDGDARQLMESYELNTEVSDKLFKLL